MARIAEQDFSEADKGERTGRTQRAISSDEVRLYNLDYDRLLDDGLSARASDILESAREYVFELVRHVMDRANQRYGGSTSLGDEIGIRMLRPDDLGMGANPATGLADSWEFTWVALAAQDIFGATTPNQVVLGDNALAEAHLIVAWTTNHPSPKTEAIQASKFGRAMVVQPLPWDVVVDGRGGIKVIEASPWFAAFPGENYEIDVNVHTVGTDVLRALGVTTVPGVNLRTM
jgi:hypothetical protein